MRIVEIPVERLSSEYPLASQAMMDLCITVRDNDPDMFEDDPWTLDGFRYYVLDPDDGTVVAERKQPPGPREPGYIWSAAIVADPHEARWFCSEDAEGPEVELGWRLSAASPGGIGGW